MPQRSLRVPAAPPHSDKTVIITSTAFQAILVVDNYTISRSSTRERKGALAVLEMRIARITSL